MLEGGLVLRGWERGKRKGRERIEGKGKGRGRNVEFHYLLLSNLTNETTSKH